MRALLVLLVLFVLYVVWQMLTKRERKTVRKGARNHVPKLVGLLVLVALLAYAAYYGSAVSLTF